MGKILNWYCEKSPDWVLFIGAILCAFTVFLSCCLLFVYVGWWCSFAPLWIASKIGGGNYMSCEDVFKDHPEYANKTKYRIYYHDGYSPLSVTDLEAGEETFITKKPSPIGKHLVQIIVVMAIGACINYICIAIT